MGFASRGCVRARDARTLDREKRAIDPEGFFAALDTRLSRGKRRVSASPRLSPRAIPTGVRFTVVRLSEQTTARFSGRGSVMSVTRPIFFF